MSLVTVVDNSIEYQAVNARRTMSVVMLYERCLSHHLTPPCLRHPALALACQSPQRSGAPAH